MTREQEQPKTPLEERLDALGALERDATPPGLASRIAQASAPSLRAEHPAVIARIGPAWASRLGALAACLALLIGVAALVVSVRPGEQIGTPTPVMATVAADMDLWLSLESMLNDPLDNRLNALHAESTALESYGEADLFTLELLSVLESM